MKTVQINLFCKLNGTFYYDKLKSGRIGDVFFIAMSVQDGPCELKEHFCHIVR